MKPLQRVVWSEGMLVSPQHMQQQDLYHERLLDERIAALSPYRWGVVSRRNRCRRAGRRPAARHQVRRHPARRALPGLRGRRSRVPAGPADRRPLSARAGGSARSSWACARSGKGCRALRPTAAAAGERVDQGGARPIPRLHPPGGRPDRQRRRPEHVLRATQRRRSCSATRRATTTTRSRSPRSCATAPAPCSSTRPTSRPRCASTASPFLMGGVRRLLGADGGQAAPAGRRSESARRFQHRVQRRRRHPVPAAQHHQHRDPAPRLRRRRTARSAPRSSTWSLIQVGRRSWRRSRPTSSPGSSRCFVAHRSARHLRGAVRPRRRRCCARPCGKATERPAGDQPVGLRRQAGGRTAAQGRVTTCWRCAPRSRRTSSLQRLPGLCKIARSAQLPQRAAFGRHARACRSRSTHRPPPEIPVRAGVIYFP